MELPRPAIAGIIAVVVILVGAVGYLIFHSDSTTLSSSEEARLQQTTQAQYQENYRRTGGPEIYLHPHEQTSVSTSTSGEPSIYHQ